jgi:hypothetical protein
MRGRGGPLRRTTASLLVSLAAVAAPLLIAPAEAGAQSAAGLCTMDAFPRGVGFSLGPHTIQLRMFCEALPEGSNQHSYEGLQITSDAPIAEFGSLEAFPCTVVASTRVECPLLLGGTESTQELYGELRFQVVTTYEVRAISAEYTTVDETGVRDTHDLPVSPLHRGFVVQIPPNPRKFAKGCVRRDFKLKVQLSDGLRQQLLDMATFGGEVSDEVPQFVARLERQGKKGATQSRLPELKYKSSLNGFKIKVPASRLSSGRYNSHVFLELSDPADYPDDILKFKVC